MKNKLFKATTLLCLVAILGACNKDKSTGTEQQANLPNANDPIEQLRTFRKQIENTGAKSDETITVSDALWGIENNFNLTYSDAESYYAQINDHEFTMYLPITSDQQVQIFDVANLYSQVTDIIRDAMASDEFDNKGFISLNILEAEEESGMMRIKFSGQTGEKTNCIQPTAHVFGPFEEDDNWMFATPFGKCDDPNIPSGADAQLQEKLYIELIEPYIDSDPGFRNIYVNRKRFVFNGTNYPKIFYTQDASDRCIDYNHMNYYYSGEKNVIKNIIPAQYHLEDYIPISITIRGVAVSNPYAITHHNCVDYGIQLKVSIEEFGEIEDLLEP